MNSFVAHVASGQVFFTGVLLVTTALLLQSQLHRRVAGRIAVLVIFVGLTGIWISGTPCPWWMFVVGTTLTILSVSKRHEWKRRWLRIGTVVLWLTAAAYEATWHWTPHVPDAVAVQHLPLVVLADSVTAGLGEGEAVTWPSLIRATSAPDVMDFSHVGETTASALRRVHDADVPDAAIVILELGGNDILGGTDVRQFEKDLDALLTFIATPGRHVFLMELPLPPFHNQWGMVQRRLAQRHGIALIPKHRFAAVFAGDTATLDSIHLSQEGHDRMAAIIREVTGIHEVR